MARLTTEHLVKLAGSPLGIVALFVFLVDGVGVYGIGITSGDVQLLLTIFVITFPLLFGLGFFLIWWKKPQALYPPSDYGGSPKVGEYADAMRDRTTEIVFASGPEKLQDTSASKSPLPGESEEKESLSLEISTTTETSEEGEPSAREKVFKAVEEGRYEDAYSKFSDVPALMTEVKDRVGHKGAFLQFLFKEGWPDAMNKLKELKEAHPEVIVLSAFLGFMYRKTHKWEQAIECYKIWKNGAKTETEVVDRRCVLAWVYFEAGQKEECLMELKESFSATSDPILLSKLYKTLGDLLLEVRKDQPQLGLACFEKEL